MSEVLDVFRMSGAQLREAAANGNPAAQAEIDRRKARRAEKRTAKVAA